MEQGRITSSFRDPSGYVFSDGDKIRRIIHPVYFRQYASLKDGGFYQKLFDKKFLVPHTEISNSGTEVILEAKKIPFINYPYEWSFLQYKHAALLTLRIQKLSLENNYTLKDASAFNIVFFEGKPIFIDTLSFDFYEDNMPWKAYKQFITHFLGPLVLCHYYGPDFLKTLATDIDGIPLQKLSKLLPFKSNFSPTLFTNIKLLAKYDGKFSGADSARQASNNLSKGAQLKLLDSLYSYIENLDANASTEWDHYYNQINYSDASYLEKKAFVADWYDSFEGDRIIDIGGNDGTFSREISQAGLLIVADVDPNAVGQNYSKVRKNKEMNILPLVADVLNPAGGYGFDNTERFSLSSRLKALQLSGCMALAVIHHITLSGNIPFHFSARYFAGLAPNLLIEFPDREDSWVQFLLKSKREFEGHFDFYNEENFEKEYAVYFEIRKKHKITGAHRILYSLKRRT